ncbi:putative phosphomutase (TIGR03848 family) [Nocardioides daedukensis]|uniref:Putative phosphomutase (TIGR03848 family) n=1 Tax=Nocardioides daedukensis TaxID=634462 RepID=A0A7Y9RZU4_9ACTN|nr:histidine phosphatase family protein [Nocardioides daedukensis]NYG57678.1 putative phosphomutase (TIGR03848 family) [Nocardioides daedukensis]
MATVILVRHGRSSANTGGVLAGRSAGVKLDETGHQQAKDAAARLAPVRLARIVTSPLERCRQTARAIAGEHPDVPVSTERGVIECDYGDWTGRTIRDLAKEALWKTVQSQPSAAAFPGGESLPAMMARATAAVRRVDAEVSAEHGEDATWVVVSHGDIIKSLLADALGMHLDLFQRIQVDPASISIIRYTPTRPFVLGQNTHAGDLSWLNAPDRKQRPHPGDAVVGGGAGPQ